MSEEVKKPPIELFGRKEILTPVESITKDNLIEVLGKALTIHEKNSAEIDYLYRYTRGKQPILSRTKTIRPEINNKVVENHAAEIVQFTSGYFLGEPVTYIRRGERDGASKGIGSLNDMMFFANKSSHDKKLATWMAIAGLGYRMALPNKKFKKDSDESPFLLDILDPRHTFVVYHSGFGHRRMMGVQEIYRYNEAKVLTKFCCGYTDTHYFEVEGQTVKVWKPHTLNDIPIFEYRLNEMMMGSFEPAVPLLDSMNTLMSNRIDGVEQFVQSFLKFVNCEVDEEKIKKLRELGAIVIKSSDGIHADVEIITQELNQSQTQTLVDYLYDQLLIICGMPTTTKGGSSTSDTGAAVFLRDGWSQCEARAKDTESLFTESERKFLRLVLRIMRQKTDCDLKLSEVDCKFTRRQHDNLLTKTQALLHMLEAGLAPEIAIATSGLFNDPMDVVQQSKEYLGKWTQKSADPAQVVETDESDEDDSDDKDSGREITKNNSQTAREGGDKSRKNNLREQNKHNGGK